MGTNFKFVIVGSGNIAGTYYALIKELENVEMVGLVSRSANQPTWLSDEGCEIKKQLKSVSCSFDAVILATPNGLHHRGAIEAARLGKHVLTEKPLDVTVKAMDSMIEACRSAKVKLGVTFQRRTSADNIVIHDLIKHNKLGNIFAADLAVKNYRPQSYYNSDLYRGTWQTDGGGPFMMQAIHHIDLYGWFFGRPSRIISAYGTFTHDVEVEDHGAAILEHDGNMIGTMIASTSIKPGYDGEFAIHSDRGTVILKNDMITFWDIEGLKNPSLHKDTTIHSGATSASVSDTSGHKAIVKDFVEAVKENRAPLIDGQSAKLATEIILQIYDR